MLEYLTLPRFGTRHTLGLGVAKKLLEEMEEVIFGLENLSLRGTLKKIGAYADKSYRQLSIKKFIVIHRVDVVNLQSF